MLQLLGLTTRNLPVVPQDLPQPVELPGPSTIYVVPLPIRVGVDLNDLAHQHAHFIQRYTGSSALNRGHKHHRSIRRFRVCEGRPRLFGGVQRGGGT